MKVKLFILVLLVLAACGRSDHRETAQRMHELTDQASSLIENAQTDSAIVMLLNANDALSGCDDSEAKYNMYATLARAYEEKNLSDQQQLWQQRMFTEAQQMNDSAKMATACFQIATTMMVQQSFANAAAEAHKAYSFVQNDSLQQKARTLLLLCQIKIQEEQTDSARYFLQQAEECYSPIKDTDLYRMSHAYVLAGNGDSDLIPYLENNIPQSGKYTKAELLRLLMFTHASEKNWQDAYADAQQLLSLTETIAEEECTETMERLHRIQHEQQMELMKERRQKDQLRSRIAICLVVIVSLALLLATAGFALCYRKKARIAHERELNAMQLAEEAQTNEEAMRNENIQLQRLYYEHLYAIILPIINARRNKSGHINLEESSWKLIEENTDMVLPGFTSRLRRNHPGLTTEDVRFCCLIMMRVPGAVMADIYGIAATSVAMRKQRMKKKLDEQLHEQTLEDYLNKYMIQA